jgi:hypothetical protein
MENEPTRTGRAVKGILVKVAVAKGDKSAALMEIVGRERVDV